jgi:two-component system, NtrC family, nitrogen regulation sensor histidine kinase NtrY
MESAKSLQHYVNVSWLLSGCLAFAATLVLFLGFALHNYSSDSKIAQTSLDDKAQVVARRLAGELLLGDRGAPKPVALDMAKEMGLAEVLFGSPSMIGSSDIKTEFLYSTLKAPFLEDKYWIRVATNKKSIFDYFNFSIMFICFTIIGVLIGVGIFTQTKYLKKHLVRPIQALVETSTGDKIACESWPKELQEISERLNSSFQDREQFVYSQIARGVIHDIKTILQSIKVASDLASESQTEARMKNLLKVSQLKLPDLLNIVDTTLDGSREIRINAQKQSLNTTVDKSIKTLRSLPISNGVEFVVEKENEVLVPHDSVQLERVFTNLIKNGLESINEKDSEQRKIHIRFSLAEKDFVAVRIEDSGKGLPKNADSVFRLLKSTKEHGSGIGLRVSTKIVEAHLGRLAASHSAELGGARFDVILPREGSI